MQVICGQDQLVSSRSITIFDQTDQFVPIILIRGLDSSVGRNIKKEKNYCTIHEFEPEDTEGYKTGFRIRISSMTEMI
ncbi:MAG: hypothetical protein ACP5F1_06965, partial [Thermoplasmata archaeon]